MLGRTSDADRYGELAANVRRAWQAAFVRADGRIGADRQDDYVRALAFDLLPQEQRRRAVDLLVERIEDAGDDLATGFLSTPMLLRVLVDNDRADVAFRLLMQDTAPFWLHQVERRATTIWETWDGHDSKGRGGGSHNHYAFGAVAAFLSESVLGITPVAPGYRRVRIAPIIGGGLTRAAGSVETPFGAVRSRWRVDGIELHLEIDLPAGTEGDVELPDTESRHVGSGRHVFASELSRR